MLIFTLFGSFLLYNCRMFSSYNHNSVSRVTRSSTGIILSPSFFRLDGQPEMKAKKPEARGRSPITTSLRCLVGHPNAPQPRGRRPLGLIGPKGL